MPDFDIVIIGSGPAAIAALTALDPGRRIGIITGATPFPVAGSLIASKIRAVAASFNEAPGLAEPLMVLNAPRTALLSTAAIGGLANYWGQQFFRYLPDDPWPSLFADYTDYESECISIEELFHVAGGEKLATRASVGTGFIARTPRLVAGTRDDHAAGLLAMRQAYQAQKRRTNATALTARASSFTRTSEAWRVLLEDGAALTAGRILLAAGVLGDARLLLRSYPDLEAASFRDHSPWVLYVLGLAALFAARPAAALPHINAVNLEQQEGNRCASFVSIYDMQQADLNLIMALSLGWASPSLRGWPAPPGVSVIKPVQVWTPTTDCLIEIQAQTVTAKVHSCVKSELKADAYLAAATHALKQFGAQVLKIGRTTPGQGFHYHALKLKPKSRGFMPISDLLHDRTQNSVVCVDASVLSAISQRPHTLTAMANARRVAAVNT